MTITVLALARLARLLGRAIADPATRGVVALGAATLAIGTVFYSRAEGWSVVDSLYFSVMTLLTIGYGDLTPTSELTKLFTVVYALLGVGLIASFIAALAIHARRHAGHSGWPQDLRHRGEGSGRSGKLDES